jgi:uncharacterized phage protein (TIGR01671 family)
MREILFRGQTRRKGEKVWMDGSPVDSNWVYGGVLCGNGDHSIIYQTEPDIEKKVVYTETVGQYTGLTDKNGVKIFEGDIVLITKNTVTDVVAKIFYSEGAFRTNAANTYDGEEPLSFWLANDCDFEVIGNIYDNPELIGGEQNAEN